MIDGKRFLEKFREHPFHALGEGQDPACVGRSLEAWLSAELGEP
jgi:hypothetical protein